MAEFETQLPVAELRKVIQTEFIYKRHVYWLDFLLSITTTWTTLLATYELPFGLQRILLTIIGIYAGYRSVLFIHEIAHFKKDSVPGFTVVWNLLCGIPFFAPSFMYRGVHNDHHSKLIYGTKEDGEYVPFGIDSPKRIVMYLATPLISPLLLALRFGILAPLSWLIPSFRRIVISQLSSLVIDFEYVRTHPTAAEREDWRWQEPLCFLWFATIAYFTYTGAIPWSWHLHYYSFSSVMFFINSVRTIVAHRYGNPGEQISMTEQFLDSINIVGSPFISSYICPVGLRYHALHHLFPTIPYHSLDDAHKKLMRFLPATSPYHLVNEPTVWGALQKLWRTARAAKPSQRAEKVSILIPNFFEKRDSRENTNPADLP